MDSRLELQAKLEEILGSANVYYQPPSTITMDYPAIVYSRDALKSTFANDIVYTIVKGYKITVIDEDPDSEIVERIALMPTCRFITHFASENLNHDVFAIQY